MILALYRYLTMSNCSKDFIELRSSFRWLEEDEDDLRLRHYYQHQLRSLLDAADSSGPYVGHDEVGAQIWLSP